MAEELVNQHQEAIMELVREEFRKRYSSSSASVLLGNVTLASYDGGQVVLNVNSVFIYKILSERYQTALEETFTKLLGFEVRVLLRNTGAPADPERMIRNLQRDVYGHPLEPASNDGESAEERDPEKDDLFSYSDGNGTDAPEPPFLSKTKASIPKTARIDADGRVILPEYNFEYTFDNFIVGSSNTLAHAACLSVVRKPARDYNPLFIYGPSGIGKTHLLWATMNKMRETNPNIRMVYIKSEDFINEMVDRMSRQEMKKFRDKYRSCDVLLIDDIQFLAGKVAMQEEFFHTFNALYESAKQIILTSDRPPHEIQHLEDRLVSRFEWGLLADIQPPDLELRMAIIKTKAEQVGIEISEEILVYLAENLRSNIRQLEGAIKKLGACHFLGQKVTMELARGCITELLGGAEPQNVTVGKIFTAVCRKYNVTKEDLVSKKRSKEVAFARHVTMYFMRQITEMSFPTIGKQFDRDHTTVLASVELIDRKIRTDREFAAEYESIKKEIIGG